MPYKLARLKTLPAERASEIYLNFSPGAGSKSHSLRIEKLRIFGGNEKPADKLQSCMWLNEPLFFLAKFRIREKDYLRGNDSNKN